jgi:SAM-dependent methyltransferase
MKKGLPNSKQEIYVPSLIKKLNLRNPAKFFKICKVALGITTYFVGVSFAYSYFHQSAEIPAEKRNEVGGTAFDDLAPYYDSKLALDEFFMGISKLRKRCVFLVIFQLLLCHGHHNIIFLTLIFLTHLVISQAKGHTLEIACGTGKNIRIYKYLVFFYFVLILLAYYTLYSVKSVIGIDSSISMLEEARMKVINHPKRNSIFKFINGNVEKLDFKDNSFDTVVCLGLFNVNFYGIVPL